MKECQKGFKKYLGEIVYLTLEKSDYNGKRYDKYEGIILPIFKASEDSFIAEEYFFIYDLNLNKEKRFRLRDVFEVNYRETAEKDRKILLEMYELTCENIELEKQEYLISLKKEINKKRFSSYEKRLIEASDYITFPNFKELFKESLNQLVKEGKISSGMEIDDDFMIGEYDIKFLGDSKTIKSIKLFKSENIEKYAHRAGYPFISTYEDYDGTVSAQINFKHESYKLILKDYKKGNIKLSLNEKITSKDESYLSLGDKYWLRYHHEITIDFKKPLDIKKESVNELVTIFKK